MEDMKEDSKKELKKLRGVLYLIVLIDIGIVSIGKKWDSFKNSVNTQVEEIAVEDENSADNESIENESITDASLEVKDENTNENIEVIPPLTEVAAEPQVVTETIELNKFYVLDTNSNGVSNISGENDRYYLLMNNYSVYIDEEDYMIYSFEDTVNKEAFAQAENSKGTFHLAYSNEANDCFVDYRVENVSTTLVDLNQFLIENNLANLVNETGEYTDDEIVIIQERLRQINNEEMVEAKQKKYQ